MKTHLNALLLLRSVFSSASQGKGLAASLVETFRDGTEDQREVARRLLLGFPARSALEPLAAGRSEEVSVLSALLANSPSSSAKAVGEKGKSLSMLFERWIRMREAHDMELKVMQMRSHLMSAVMGAVVAMLASLGPLVAGLSFFSQPTGASGGELLTWSAVVVATSSATLGVFMSGRRFFVDVAISLVVFAVTAAAVAPLASVPVVNLWGIK
jgi:hypothetical protein